MTTDGVSAQEALRSFSAARRRAQLRALLAAFGRREGGLLSYEDVRRRLHAVEASTPVLEDVPLDAIVGSVGRYNDFTREFLPKSDADRERWVKVNLAMTGQLGTPPVELYRVGQTYFVRDGNHRVSVARQLGASTIQAYVTPVHVRAPLPASAQPDDVILAVEHARFMEETGLDELRPDVDLRLTACGAYDALREHIAVHRYFMGLERDGPVEAGEAVLHWCDLVYLPVVRAIRATGVLRDFPGRTEADLYLWLSDHRGRLASELGFELPSETIAEHLQPGARHDAEERLGLIESVRRAGPQHRDGAAALVDDVLVVVTDREEERVVLEQALLVARNEGARLYGVQVVEAQVAAEGGEATRRADFERASEAAGVESQFVVAHGAPSAVVRSRLPWFDVVVLRLVERAAQGRKRLNPAYRALLRRPARPVLAVAESVSRLEHALLAFDGSEASEAALFAAAYLSAKWGTSLTVVTVRDRAAAPASGPLQAARSALERYGIQADYVAARGPVADGLAAVAEARGCDLIIMRGYRFAPWVETMLGGAVERTVALDARPVLIV